MRRKHLRLVSPERLVGGYSGAKPGRQTTVLVVDDDRDIREMFTSALRRAGFDVRLAVDGLTALQQIEYVLPDVVVLDLDLPLMNGLVIHQELESSERTRHVPVVIVTGTEWVSPCAAYATLRKPISPEELVNVVRQAGVTRRL